MFGFSNAVVCAMLAALMWSFPAFAAGGGGGEHLAEDAPINIQDPYIQRLHDLIYDQKPPRPVPGVDYGMDPKTGVFQHPRATPMVIDPPNFPGQLDYWDQRSYAKNVEVLGVYPKISSPFHSWQNIVDWGDRRIMYVYGAENLKIWDITDPRAAKLLLTRGSDWSGKGPYRMHAKLKAGDIRLYSKGAL